MRGTLHTHMVCADVCVCVGPIILGRICYNNIKPRSAYARISFISPYKFVQVRICKRMSRNVPEGVH